jgi:hypothetical protein
LVAATAALDEIGVARQHLQEAATLQRRLEQMDLMVSKLHANC